MLDQQTHSSITSLQKTTLKSQTVSSYSPQDVAVKVLDVAGILEMNKIACKSELTPELCDLVNSVGEAVLEVGFFVAAPNHGVKGLSEVENVARDFFTRSEDEKTQWSMLRNATFRGYSPLRGETTLGTKDNKECYDLGTDHAQPHPLGSFMGCNPYPSEEFKTACQNYHDEMRAFGHAIMRCLALYIGLELDAMTTTSKSKSENHLFRLLSYPPAPSASTRVIGLNAHIDYGALAMLFATEGGLQAFTRQEKWVDVPHVPGSIVVNIGDMVEIWSSGIYRATLHRVVHQNTITRYSFPFFYEPPFDATVRSLPLDYSHPIVGRCQDLVEVYKPVVYKNHVLSGTSKSFAHHPFAKECLASL